jgi:hypothetical protein
MGGREAFAKRLAVGGTASAGTVRSWQKLVEKDAMADSRITNFVNIPELGFTRCF